MAPSDPPGTVLEDCLRVRQSGAIRVLVALVRMILDLWARASSMWLLGEFGILLFCSPGFWLLENMHRALGVFCARFPPREARIFISISMRVFLISE